MSNVSTQQPLDPDPTTWAEVRFLTAEETIIVQEVLEVLKRRRCPLGVCLKALLTCAPIQAGKGHSLKRFPSFCQEQARFTQMRSVN